jgi:hypothetical protein
MDGNRLLESDSVGDNVIAILARLRDHKEAVRRIVKRIAGLAAMERETALAQLFILAGLRRLGTTVKQEAGHMPIQTSILEHDVLGPLFQRGVNEGRQEGRQEGRREGEQTILRRLLAKRFGDLPGWANEKLAALPAPELEELSERVLDAASIEDLLG